MENDPREIELNFNGSSAPAGEENSGAAAENSAADEVVFFEEFANEEFAEAAADDQPAESAVANAAASTVNNSDVLRSQQPMNRPAGTPPLENSSGRERMSAVELVVMGKSYGTALRLLREHHQVSLKEIEQATLIQVHFLEALESENLSALPPLVYVIAFIRSLCNYYNLSSETSSQLVAKLKEQLEYTCNEGMMSTLDVDSSGAEVNEKRIKRIAWIFAGSLVILILAITLIVLACKGSDAPQVEVVEIPAGKQQHFDPNTIDALLQPPALDLPKLPVAE